MVERKVDLWKWFIFLQLEKSMEINYQVLLHFTHFSSNFTVFFKGNFVYFCSARRSGSSKARYFKKTKSSMDRPPISDAKYQTVPELREGVFGHRNDPEKIAGFVRVTRIIPTIWVSAKLKDLSNFRCAFNPNAPPETIKTYVIGPKVKIQKRGQIFARYDIEVVGNMINGNAAVCGNNLYPMMSGEEFLEKNGQPDEDQRPAAFTEDEILGLFEPKEVWSASRREEKT